MGDMALSTQKLTQNALIIWLIINDENISALRSRRCFPSTIDRFDETVWA
jgi:hypothetical protein